MSEEKQSVSFPGRYFWVGLTLLFTHHKLVGTIDWSWWWVMAPVWITTIVVVVFQTIDNLIKEARK